MDINEFDDLLIRGFDMEFTYKSTFYSITKGVLNEKIVYSIADNKGWYIMVDSIAEVNDYVVDNKKLKNIIETIPEEEMCY